MTRVCKRCSVHTALTEKEISKMVNEVASMKGIRLADGDLYEKRFKVCSECGRLLYGSTCGVCGCVMQVRARLADGKCPQKRW